MYYWVNFRDGVLLLGYYNICHRDIYNKKHLTGCPKPTSAPIIILLVGIFILWLSEKLKKILNYVLWRYKE